MPWVVMTQCDFPVFTVEKVMCSQGHAGRVKQCFYFKTESIVQQFHGSLFYIDHVFTAASASKLDAKVPNVA